LGLEKGRIGIVTMRIMSAQVYQGLLGQLPDAELVDASDLIRQIRMVKSPVELEFMRKSGKCADKGWEAMRDRANRGCENWKSLWHAITQSNFMEASRALISS